MRIDEEWFDYKIIRSGDGYRLEEYSSSIRLLRPDPQIIWPATPKFDFKKECDAYYERGSKGGGRWVYNRKIEGDFSVKWRNFQFSLRLMASKQTGLFPEQAYNWARLIDTLNKDSSNINVLNLFAYTGGATLAALSSGARVCHVDASKPMCERAKINIINSNLDKKNARFIVDDCFKFVNREISRKSYYDAIILDPPSFGRGPNGEIWRIEDKIYDLIELCKNILSSTPRFILLNSYTTGILPATMNVILNKIFYKKSILVDSYEIALATEEKGVNIPCGSSAFLEFK